MSNPTAPHSALAPLEQWAVVQPDEPAYIDATTTLTYGEWNAAADRLASALEERGLRSGDSVSVRSRIRAEWLIVNRALGKLGCQSVCMSWRLTGPEASHIARDSGSRFVICDDADPAPLAGALADAGVAAELLTMGQPSSGPTGTRIADLVERGTPTPRPTPMLTQLVLYTSGTTGAPRGVHSVNRLNSSAEAFGRHMLDVMSSPPLGAAPRTLLTLPLHHGAGPFAAGRTHAAGGLVVGLDPFDAEEALRLIERHRITQWTTVPTMLLRIRALGDEVIGRYDLSSLEAVSVGAAAVPPLLKEWFVARVGNLLWEAYGLSEAGMISVLSPEDYLRKPASSGRPYVGVEVRVVDDAWHEVPSGGSGEIAVRSPNTVGRYLGGEAFDATTLDPDGFLRTGDIGHLDEDGYLYLTDRRKDMIVAGGVNIYPAEIEHVLIEHPDVVDVAVIGVPEDTFGEQVKAFIETRAGSAPSAEDVIAFCSERLAKYKHPRLIEFVEDLPRNPMGKVLKTALRNNEWEGRERKI